MMFQLPTLRCFDFDARLLSIESIDDAKYESCEDSEPDAANYECRGRTAADDKPAIVIWFGVIRVLQRREMIAVSIGA